MTIQMGSQRLDTTSRNMRRRKAKQEESDQLLVCDHPSRSIPNFPQTIPRSTSSTKRQIIVNLLLCGLLIIAQDPPVESQQQTIVSSSNLWPQQQSSANVDYSHLAQLFQLQAPAAAKNRAGSHGWTAPADPNNRTTMRFFRNNKTFASVVYANEHQPNTQQFFNVPQIGNDDNSNNNNNNQRQHQQSQQQQQSYNALNRLINCHLVDLDQHSSDVVLFESKYRIKTMDVEFGDMMHLIEACTEIARLRMPPINRLVATYSGYQANGTGVGSNKQAPVSAVAASAASLALPPPTMMKPLLVVGRPMPAAGSMTTTSSSSSAAATSSSRSANEPPLSIVGANQEVASSRTRRRIAPQAGAQLTDHAKYQQIHKHQHQHLHQHLHQQQLQQQQQQQDDQQHRLTLGEVTPPASLVVNSKLREAIQEITSYDTSDLMSIWRGILPGTNWCGMGDRATSYNDLGFESDIDICCRAHDFCPIRLAAFSSGYGLFNWSFYTRSHCRCDQNFLDCLRRAESPLASVVMKFYFAIMKTTCLHDNQTAHSDADASTNFGLTMGSNSLSSTNLASSNGRGINTRNGNSNSNSNKLFAGSKLFEQLRAKLPIPRAVERSQVLLSKLDTKQQQSQIQR